MGKKKMERVIDQVEFVPSKGIDFKESSKVFLGLTQTDYFDDEAFIAEVDNNTDSSRPYSITGLLKDISDKYGRSMAAYYYFICLNRWINADGSEQSGTGGYDYWIDAGYLTSDECQDAEIYKLEGYVYGMRLIIEFLEAKHISTYNIGHHIAKVKIKIDTRETIGRYDEEYKDLLQKLEKILEKDDGEVQLCQRCGSNNIVFENTKQGEIRNREEVYKWSSELDDIWRELNLYEVFAESLLRDRKQEKVIDLHVCDNDYNGIVPTSTWYYSDMLGHPGYVLNQFKDSFEQFLNSNKSIFYVDTYSDQVLNHIRYLVNKKKIVLRNNVFIYRDNENIVHEISINEKGDFEPDFPKGFYDLTLQDIYDLRAD